ncbi:hypothetical protein TTHERM_001341641 (macronuclear) [Tetrahymena thermophila SB210]|uniref:Transmembrane protein n=1 Tax=Tetrahymena thermophila (strain SB210) TaxID=312017 RepID=W7XBI4_TETTS|nr:hypothetical protein TTHERM_001341641 [Tetrahymena thermophila SB210]EWS71036.1 hypothetical protein TTHERM_001341641 [Tetrahymena thermophila SB210]|eukprot:XP_012656429.1 hypothetical protein TTHERM_001341641 [Tetrahymena thermophila SB210]
MAFNQMHLFLINQLIFQLSYLLCRNKKIQQSYQIQLNKNIIYNEKTALQGTQNFQIRSGASLGFKNLFFSKKMICYKNMRYILFQIQHFVNLKLSKNSKKSCFKLIQLYLLCYKDLLHFAFYKLNRHFTLFNQEDKMKKQYEIIILINN